MQLSPGDRRHYKKTTLTYLRGYAMDETPVHADLEPPPELPTATRPSEQPLSAVATAVDTSKGPKWVQNDRKVGQQANLKELRTPLWACLQYKQHTLV